MSKEDYYTVLGISKGASAKEIKDAYRAMAKKYHPDLNKGDANAEQKFKQINEAYETLKDDQKRAAYDQYGHGAFEGGAGHGFHGNQDFGGFGGGFGFGGDDINDVFEAIFGRGHGAKRTRKPTLKQPGADLKYELNITLEEAFTGVDKNISFASAVRCDTCSATGSRTKSGATTCQACNGRGAVRMQSGIFMVEQTCGNCGGSGQQIKDPCGTCHGKGRIQKQRNLQVSIPHGVETGSKIRLAGEGEAGLCGGDAGDLYIFVYVKQHALFRVEGANLHCRVPVSFATAALGGKVDIPGIDGAQVTAKVPAGSQNEDVIRVKDAGMKRVRSDKRGELFVHLFVEVPKNLTKRQKELLEELQSEEEKQEQKTSFFDKVKGLWS